MENTFSLDTTIFAWATAGDRATRAILRLSGPDTFRHLKTIFIPDHPYSIARKIVSGTLAFSRDLSIRCRTWIFPNPHSYTGQDMVEIHTVSSPPLQQLVNHKLLRLGLSPAKPGEFSARAFLLGKMDLTQAQAVGQLIEAQNDAQIQAALNMLGGSLHRKIESIYNTLTELSTALEANIDFSEEDIEFVSLDTLNQKLNFLQNTITTILNEAIDTQTIRSIPRVFLAGPANAGKSTLLNRLTGIDRALCSPLPGTTRDILSAIWRYRDRELLLCDTPGLLNTMPDQITRSAIERVKTFVRLADLVLFIFDAERDLENQVQLIDIFSVNTSDALVVLNKIDRLDDQTVKKQVIRLKTLFKNNKNEIFPISARTGDRTDTLTHAVFDRLSNRTLTTAANQVALDLRGREILQNAMSCIRQAKDDAETLKNKDNILGLETVAVDVQQALRILGSLLGKDVTDDVLDHIFSRFCIGK